MLIKPRHRDHNTRRTSSPMADVAFLLLIFFLVAATIDIDSGLRLQLPPSGVDPPPISQRNLLNVLVGDDGVVLIDGREASVDQISGEVARHVTNAGQDPQYSHSPQHAIVSFKAGRAVGYARYIDAIDAIMLGYREVHDVEAQAVGFADYRTYRAQLAGAPDEIGQRFPIRLSMAEQN